MAKRMRIEDRIITDLERNKITLSHYKACKITELICSRHNYDIVYSLVERGMLYLSNGPGKFRKNVAYVTLQDMGVDPQTVAQPYDVSHTGDIIRFNDQTLLGKPKKKSSLYSNSD